MLTVHEVAKRLTCSPALVYALCARGRLPHHRLGVGRGTIRITEEALEQFLEETRVERPCSTPMSLKHITLK